MKLIECRHRRNLVDDFLARADEDITIARGRGGGANVCSSSC